MVHCICPRWREEDGGSDDANGSCASRGIILLGAPALVPRPLYQRRPTVSAGPMLEKVVIPLQLFLPLPFNSVSTREKLVTMRMPLRGSPSQFALATLPGTKIRWRGCLRKRTPGLLAMTGEPAKLSHPPPSSFGGRIRGHPSIPPPHHQSCHGRANDKSFDWGVVGDRLIRRDFISSPPKLPKMLFLDQTSIPRQGSCTVFNLSTWLAPRSRPPLRTPG